MACVAPRWGNEDRERKAAAIWATLELHGVPMLGDRVWLDAGCGSGGIAAELATRVSEIVGVDPEPWPSWPEAMMAKPNLNLLSGRFDVEALPVAEGTIGVAVCNQVYEHTGNPAQLVRNLYRVMAGGGVCYFAGPNLLWPIEPHVFWPFIHWLPRRLAQRLMRAFGSRQAEQLDAYSTHCLRLRSWFRAAGFQVENGLRARIEVGLRATGWGRAAGWIGHVPSALFVLSEPFAPGLVYVLHKPCVGVPK